MTKRILVVEDQEDLRAILRDFLTASGYTVIEAVDGVEGVAKARSEHPDLVLLDIPRWLRCDSSDQGAAWSRRSPDHRGKFLRHEGGEEKAQASGCDGYVTKPYSPVQLLGIIRGYLGEKG
jgi:two-component system cell cycle response regulator DivK